MFILLTIISFFTATLSALTGMAGGIALLSIMTIFLPLSISIPLHGIVQLFSNSVRCFFLRQNIRFDMAIPFYIGLPFGTYISYELLKYVRGPTFALILIIFLIFYSVLRPKNLPQLKIPKWSFSLLGLFVGSLSLFIGAIGPVIAPFFIRDDLGKEEIVATKSFMQMGGHFLKIPAFFALGFEYGPYFTPLFSMVIMTIIGTKFGVIILKSINEKLFTIIYKVILFTAGVKLLFKIL